MADGQMLMDGWLMADTDGRMADGRMLMCVCMSVCMYVCMYV